MATVMKMSTMQLTENYVATGQATADDPNTWAIYHGTVGIVAQQGEIESYL